MDRKHYGKRRKYTGCSQNLSLGIRVNSFLDWSKFKAFLGWTEKNVGKGENAGYQHFLLFSQYCKSLLFQGRLKSGL